MSAGASGRGRRARPSARLALRLAVAVMASGCGITQMQNLAFRVDNRLQFVSPPARSLVRNPVTIRWRMSDFRIEAEGSGAAERGAGYFAVFVDRAPIRPGATMRAVASRDLECLHQPGCPNQAYLAERQIYTTTREVLTLGEIPPLSDDSDSVQLHTITIVLMDTTGHRIGESAWELDVRMRQAGP